MIRTVLFAVMLSLGGLAVLLPATCAYASNEKGFFSFFNRTKDDGSDKGKPVHMQPGISGAGKASDITPFSFSKNPAAQTGRHKASSLEQERARAAKVFTDWNANELAKANARTAALIEQVKAQQQSNRQAARQRQAQKIAQAGSGMTAGVPPSSGNAALAQAMRESARQQVFSSMSGSVGEPPLPTPKVTPVPSEAPKNEKPKRERKSQGLFNRITE